LITMTEEAVKLITPYGGKLVNLLISGSEREQMVAQASRIPSIQLEPRALCDLELLAVGGFSPLDRFMGAADYQRVLHEMRLADGTLFPIPITLTADPRGLPSIGCQIALRDAHNHLLAVMALEEVFEWNPALEAEMVLGTTDSRHPLVSEMITWRPVCISGKLQMIEIPKAYDSVDLRLTPAQTRARLMALGNNQVVAFQTRNPMHRAHEELTKRAAALIDGTLLLHPSVGMTKPGDVDHFSRVRIYRTMVERYYDESRTLLSLLPLAMRMAGPREALWHAIIRRNYGASYFIVGRDHAGPGQDSKGKPFYDPYAAQEAVTHHQQELGIIPLCFQEMVYLADEDRYVEQDCVPFGSRTISISGTQVREDYLAKGRLLPTWFTRRETAEILAQVYLPRNKQGFCLWFTGLSGSGKTSIAEIATVLLLERGRQSTLLDGDVVRTHLSKGLGFSREDRDTNILRIGFVASQIVRHNGIVICAAISPYRATRDECRKMIGSDNFIEIYLDTPLEVCEQRDVKGFYLRARRGELKGFTGIDDPYEPPPQPEVVLHTTVVTPEENARTLITYLEAKGFLQSVR
jgi:sulfate adenylyltransferase